MILAERVVDHVVVIDIGGRLTSADVVALRGTMTALLKRGATQVVFDLAELSYVDSSGLGELIACQLRAIKASVTMKLANAGHRLEDLLLLTRLITVFESYDSLPGALESFEER